MCCQSIGDIVISSGGGHRVMKTSARVRVTEMYWSLMMKMRARTRKNKLTNNMSYNLHSTHAFLLDNITSDSGSDSALSNIASTPRTSDSIQ
jgi:hypothetical protein